MYLVLIFIMECKLVHKVFEDVFLFKVGSYLDNHLEHLVKSCTRALICWLTQCVTSAYGDERVECWELSNVSANIALAIFRVNI
jgi:hypothetical protein